MRDVRISDLDFVRERSLTQVDGVASVEAAMFLDGHLASLHFVFCHFLS